MGLWKGFKDKVVAGRMLDEELYAIAIHEFESGKRRDGLWAKAIVEGGGDEGRVKAAYLRLLVQKFWDEHYLGERVQEVEGKSKLPPRPEKPQAQEVARETTCFRCKHFHTYGWDQSAGRCEVHNKKVKAYKTCSHFSKA